MLAGHTGYVSSVAFSPDGRTLASGGLDHGVRLWDVATGALVRILVGHTDSVDLVAFGPGGGTLVSGSADAIRLWDVATGTALSTLDCRRVHISLSAFLPDGHTLIVTDNDNDTTKLIDVRTGIVLRTLSSYSDYSVALTPDGKSLAMGRSDGIVEIWEVATGVKLRSLEGHTSWVSSVAFAPDGRSLASGSGDGTVKLWNTSDGRELCTLISFDDGTWAVTDKDGRFDGSDGGNVSGLHWVYDDVAHHRMEPIDLIQFKRDYYEPGLLAKVMGFNKEPLRMVKSLNEIDIKLPPGVSVVLHGNKAVVTLTDRGGGIGPTEVSIDGAHIRTEPKPNFTGKPYRFVVDLAPFKGKLLPGADNRISVVAHTYDEKARPDRPDYLASRATEATLPKALAPAAESPRIFLLACGSSDYAGPKLQLLYAAKDAIDISHVLTEAAETWVGKDKVFSTLLAGDRDHPELKPPTQKNLLAALADITAKAKSTDIVVLYLSGHGVAAGSDDQDYYYVCSNADDASPGTLLFKSVTLSGRAIADYLAKMNAAKKVVILDTCASGAFGRREVGSDLRRAWEDMKDRSGTYVLAGCAADAVSYESSRFNQGLLTYALIESIKKNDDIWNKDHLLDAPRWLASAETSVQRLVDEAQIEGVQRPEFKAGKDSNDFFVGKLSSDERVAIPLALPLPILLPVETVFDLDDPSAEDTLGLRTKINDLLMARSSRGRGKGYALWRTDAQPGAYKFNVRYKRGAETTATVSLLKFPKDPKSRAEPVSTFAVTASAEKLPELLLAEVVHRIGG